jgi:hypothetical protein
MRKLLFLTAIVIGIVWLDLSVCQQDSRVAVLFCCREQLFALRKGAQGLAQSMQQQMGQGPGPGRTGRLGPPRAQQDTDPLGRPLRGREYGDDYTVKVPGEIDVQRARRIIEELRRRFGDVLRPQEELDYIERLLKDY